MFWSVKDIQSNLDKWDTQRPIPTVPHSQVSHIARACAQQKLFRRTRKTVPHRQVSHITTSHIARFDCISCDMLEELRIGNFYVLFHTKKWRPIIQPRIIPATNNPSDGLSSRRIVHDQSSGDELSWIKCLPSFSLNLDICHTTLNDIFQTFGAILWQYKLQ